MLPEQTERTSVCEVLLLLLRGCKVRNRNTTQRNDAINVDSFILHVFGLIWHFYLLKMLRGLRVKYVCMFALCALITVLCHSSHGWAVFESNMKVCVEVLVAPCAQAT